VKGRAEFQLLDNFTFSAVQFIQTVVNLNLGKIVQRHFDEDISVLRFGRPKLVIKLLEFGVLSNGVADQAKSLGTAAFNNRCQQEPVPESIQGIAATEVYQRFDVGILGHFTGESDAASARARLARAQTAVAAVKAGAIAQASGEPGAIRGEIDAARLKAISEILDE